MASLGTSAFHWFHANPMGDVEIASWAVTSTWLELQI